MKLKVKVTKFHEYETEIEVPDDPRIGNDPMSRTRSPGAQQAYDQIRELYDDHFTETDAHYQMSIETEDGEDLTGMIQPDNTLIHV